MAVVINEFEVLDTPQQQPRGDGNAAPPSAAPPPDPEDLRRLQAVATELMLRRLAH
ncbi:hypothetical protein [Roseateles sp.]|uniref:hypothetical protein n=1 Tax=Roseateles sp. TaxID=1971397 RepID=UPI0027FE5078|nr:hypothetical protein [Roseateles sp.]MBT9491869.1 hypothetical protein [Roseateles sp.]